MPKLLLKVDVFLSYWHTVACSLMTGNGLLRSSFPKLIFGGLLSVCVLLGLRTFSCFYLVIISTAKSLNLCLATRLLFYDRRSTELPPDCDLESGRVFICFCCLTLMKLAILEKFVDDGVAVLLGLTMPHDGLLLNWEMPVRFPIPWSIS